VLLQGYTSACAGACAYATSGVNEDVVVTEIRSRLCVAFSKVGSDLVAGALSSVAYHPSASNRCDGVHKALVLRAMLQRDQGGRGGH
jgi:hypothetical protein